MPVRLQAEWLAELAAAAPRAVVTTDPAANADHAHDWWSRALMRRRAGEDLPAPDAVVAPADVDEVAAVVRWAHRHGVAVVPFGAGTGVCGGAMPVAGAITLDLKRLNRIGPVDDVSGTVTVEPGVVAQVLEDHVAARGWTTGHVPSSIHCSTIGGFLAIRSAGQASAQHGKLEDRVVGLDVVLGDGRVLRRRAVPQSSTGIDLARLFLGGEGTTGIIVGATLSLVPAPERTVDRGWLLPDVATGLEACRRLVRTGMVPTVVRLYDEADTALQYASRGEEVPDGCLLVTGCEGRADVAAFAAEVASRELADLGAVDLGPGPGERWREHRHSVSYRYADVMRPGGLVGDAAVLDTMEVAGTWAVLPRLYAEVRAALQGQVDAVLAHVSHVYATGASIYFTIVAATAGDEAAGLARYDAAWEAGQRAALGAGGTCSHHHGVGLLRAPWLAEELGEVGMQVLRGVKDACDPSGLLNPGKLGLGTVPS